MNQNPSAGAFAPHKPLTGRRSGVGTGTTSLLMIFTVLCFATLAMLSLSTAASNRRIQQRGMEGGLAAAEAKGHAAAAVARLDEALWALRAAHGEAGPYMDAALNEAEAQGWQRGEGGDTVSLLLPVDDTAQLVTELRLLPRGESYRYAVLRQATRMAGGWQPEDEGALWMP